MYKIFRWRKKLGTGSHSFSYEGQKYNLRPGEVVVCTVECMGSVSLEYDPLAEIVDGESVPFRGQHPWLAAQDFLEMEDEEVAQKGGLEIVAVGGGWYNVINPDNPDKPLSDKNLRKDAAEELIVSLGGEVPEEDEDEQTRKRTRSK